jgi:hypothetical protein
MVSITANEPRKIPGQKLNPHSVNTARAIPEGGQNRVIFEPMCGMLKPSIAPM